MAVNVARIFENSIKKGKPYCRICLRTDEETTLVTPRNILLFTEVLKLNLFDSKKNHTVCYMCEATSTTAMKMYQACVNAVSIQNVCHPMKTMQPTHRVPDWLRSALRECNNNLREYRQRTTLLQTEVLVVDSTGVEWQQHDKSLNPVQITAPRIPTPSQQQYETVIIDDDEEPPTTIDKPVPLVPIEQMLDPKLQHTSIASILPNQMQVIKRHEVDTFVLHPLVVRPDGKMVAPSLSSYIKDDHLVYDPNVYEKMPLIDCINKDEVQCVIENPRRLASNVPSGAGKETDSTEEEILPDKKKKNNYSTYSIVHTEYATDNIKRSSNYLKQPSTNYENKTRLLSSNETEAILRNYLLKSDMNNKRTSNNNETNEDAKKKRDNQYVVDLNMVNEILTSKCEEDPLAVISNVTGASETDGLGVITEVMSRPAGLVEKGGKIDWEDKIPMDVISFVDATDPNERELIVPDHLPVNHQRTQKPAKTAALVLLPAPAPTQTRNANKNKKTANVKLLIEQSMIEQSAVIDLC